MDPSSDASTVLSTVGDAAGRYLLGGVVAGALDAEPVRRAVFSTTLRAGLGLSLGLAAGALTYHLIRRALP